MHMTRTFVCKSWSYSFKWVVVDILALFPGAWEWLWTFMQSRNQAGGNGVGSGNVVYTQGMHADHDCAMHDTWLEPQCWWRKAEGTLRDMSNPHLQRHFYSQKYSGLHIVLVTVRIVFSGSNYCVGSLLIAAAIWWRSGYIFVPDDHENVNNDSKIAMRFQPL